MSKKFYMCAAYDTVPLTSEETKISVVFDAWSFFAKTFLDIDFFCMDMS